MSSFTELSSLDVILYRAHELTPTVWAEVERLKRELPSCDVWIVGYLADRPLPPDLAPKILFLAPEDISQLPYDGKVASLSANWAKTAGHNDLPVLAFFLRYRHYRYYWVIEYDVRYSGHWSLLFDELQPSKADLLATYVRDYTHQQHWSWWPRFVPGRRHVPQSAHMRAFLPFCRLSNVALSRIDAWYRDGADGHYEGGWPTICKAEQLKVEDIGGIGPHVPRERFGRHYVERSGHRAGEFSLVTECSSFRARPPMTEEAVVRACRSAVLWHPVKPIGPVASYSGPAWSAPPLSSSEEAGAVVFLLARGAHTVMDGPVSRLEHLLQAYRFLIKWGCEPVVCLSGLVQCAYDPTSLLWCQSPDDRKPLQVVVGPVAERLAFLCSLVNRAELPLIITSSAGVEVPFGVEMPGIQFTEDELASIIHIRVARILARASYAEVPPHLDEQVQLRECLDYPRLRPGTAQGPHKHLPLSSHVVSQDIRSLLALATAPGSPTLDLATLITGTAELHEFLRRAFPEGRPFVARGPVDRFRRLIPFAVADLLQSPYGSCVALLPQSPGDSPTTSRDALDQVAIRASPDQVPNLYHSGSVIYLNDLSSPVRLHSLARSVGAHHGQIVRRLLASVSSELGVSTAATSFSVVASRVRFSTRPHREREDVVFIQLKGSLRLKLTEDTSSDAVTVNHLSTTGQLLVDLDPGAVLFVPGGTRLQADSIGGPDGTLYGLLVLGTPRWRDAIGCVLEAPC